MISHLKLRLAASAFTLFSLLPAQPCYAQAKTGSDAMTGAIDLMPHISITSRGSGSPVVMIPGLSSPRATWDGIAPALARTHRVILVQVNGFGGDQPGANLQPGLLDGVVSDLHGWLAAHRITQTAVIGHSMGGLLALMLAKAHPDDVGRLMIVDSLPFYGVLFAPTATPAMLEPQAAAMRDGMAAAYGKPDAGQSQAIAERLALKPDSRAALVRWGKAVDQRVAGEALYEDLQTDLRPAMAAIAAPITLVYPYNDAGPTRPVADALYHQAYAAAPHVTYVPIGDAAHFVMLDQPAAFGAAVDAFLR